jgi:hypothetical protein
MIRTSKTWILWAILSSAVSGCGSQNPKLEITEIAPGVTELYLDDPDSLDLGVGGATLEVKTANYDKTLNLPGAMGARTYLVIFEKSGYTGPPVAMMFTDRFTSRQCPGIQIAENSFGWNLGGTSFAYRLHGNNGYPGGISNFFWRHWETDDAVTFGTRPRPVIGGNFIEDTSAPNPIPAAPGTLVRKWGPNGPIDNDRESDWKGSLVNTLCGPSL